MVTNGDVHDEIVRLEAQLDDLADTIESCRKFITPRLRPTWRSIRPLLVAMFVGVIQANPSVLALASAAVLGGIVAAGSSHSTAKESNARIDRG